MTAGKKEKPAAVAPPEWTPAAYELRALPFVKANRMCALRWARQKRKSTNLAKIAIYAMIKTRGQLVTYGSASLLLGREIVIKESQVFQSALRWLRQLAEREDMRLEVANAETRRAIKDIKPDDFTELFEQQKLEFRLWHDRTTFSRTQVIAPNAATARGWSGWVMLDEVAFIRDFRELMDGVLYIINARPDFHLVMATTDPADDTHYSVELLMEPVGTAFAPCAEGNVYESQGGVPVHRVSIYDSYLAGVPVYDLKTGEPITPEQSLARSPDKDSWYRNEGLRWVMGGTAAVGLLQLDTAQRRGIGEHCAHVYVDDCMDFDRALEVLRRGLGNGRVGIGVDIATTTEGTSNPTSVTVIEQRGVDLIHRLIATWKTAAEDVQQNRIAAIVDVVTERQTGGRARALAVDASNERLFADGLRRLLRGKLPVHLVVANEVVDPRPPGYEEDINYKQYLGDGYVSEIDDNHCALPPEKYIKDDYRLVKKEKGAFVCKPAADGRHGDTFDSSKLALHALRAYGGKVEANAVAVGTFRQKPAQPFVSKNPFANRFKQKPATTMS